MQDFALGAARKTQAFDVLGREERTDASSKASSQSTWWLCFCYFSGCLACRAWPLRIDPLAVRSASQLLRSTAENRPFRSSYEKGCQGKKLLPAPLRDAGVVTYIQPRLIPHLILRGVIGLVALAGRTSPRRCQPQLLVPTRRFHEVSGARRHSVPKLRKLNVG